MKLKRRSLLLWALAGVFAFFGSIVEVNAQVSAPTTQTVTVGADSIVSIPLGGGNGGGDIKMLPGGKKAYVALKYEDTVAVIDTDPLSPFFNTVLATVPVGIRPSGIAITPDGTRVYVTNSGKTSADVDSISVISTASDTVIVTSPLGSNTAPVGIAITPDGTRAYFTTFEGKLRILDTDPTSLLYNLPIDSIDIPLLLAGKIAITPDGTKAVVDWAGTIAHAIDVIDVEPESPTYHTIIGSPVPVVSGQSGDVAVSPDSAYAYATGSTSLCKLCKIDLQSFDVLTNFELFQRFIALTPDGSSLLTSDWNSTTISIFDSSDLSLSDSVELDNSLGDITISPDGLLAYVVRDPISSNSEVLMVPLQPVVAYFSASPKSGLAPLNVSFSDNSIGATSWSWDFGDGSTSVVQNPTHTYEESGSYTVSLTASRSGESDTEIEIDYINVIESRTMPWIPLLLDD